MDTALNNVVSELHNFLEESQISSNDSILELHSRDESYHLPSRPDVVVYPKTAEQVVAIVKLASENSVSIYPFGMGSSLEGHVIPYEHGITIDFSLMNKIIDIKEKDFLVTLQPGVTRTQLNKELKKYGLFFPVDPGADATLGGMAATNASGTLSVKYGTMRDNVRDMEVILADGMKIHTGTLAAKSSSGYHLNGLFIGSEGTLGCITELTLKVCGIPEFMTAARATFQTVEDAIEGVVAILQAGIPMGRIEIVDEESIRQVNRFSESNYTELPTLFLEFHGNEAGLQQDIAFTQEIVADFNCLNIQFETDTAARNLLWDARHNLAYAYIHSYPGRKMMVTDVCLPISELAGAIGHARQVLDKLGLPGGITGHVGDGNYHIILMIDMNDLEEVQKAKDLNEQIVEYSLARGGTCTGEHGVGIGKRKYQEKEHGDALKIMQKIKQVLDPNSILNPNKLI
ncbi:FAD-binding oxidoreductase [Oceanobacillus massiliensis]|uniref:FAD-binding oxidoreductase n=1 Tax=Oceanobacillus massiliensis TaxID=1465765 RepID=UPI000287E3C7|nr:FAD-linked oxidase C-terminal domain-containing protein [Oceanobacillus massiliensis]